MKRSFFVLLVPFAVACSSGSSGSSCVTSTKEGFVATYCDAFAPCCAKAGRPTDGMTCRAFLGAFAVGTYDPVQGQKCANEIQAAKSNPAFCDTSSNSNLAPSCKNVLSSSGGGGAAKPGDTCTKDSDCASSSEGDVHCASVFTSGATIKKCQVVSVGKEGSTPCVATIDGNVTSWVTSFDAKDVIPKGFSCDRAAGLFCDSKTTTCIKLGAVGDACSSSSACSTGAFCDFSTSKCATQKATGEACSGFDDCVKGDWCDSSGTKTCKAQIADGAACTVSNECASSSCTNGKCQSSDFGLALLCGGN
jgi:hypothetical protein